MDPAPEPPTETLSPTLPWGCGVPWACVGFPATRSTPRRTCVGLRTPSVAWVLIAVRTRQRATLFLWPWWPNPTRTRARRTLPGASPCGLNTSWCVAARTGLKACVCPTASGVEMSRAAMREIAPTTITSVPRPWVHAVDTGIPFGNRAISRCETSGFASPPHGGFALVEGPSPIGLPFRTSDRPRWPVK